MASSRGLNRFLGINKAVMEINTNGEKKIVSYNEFMRIKRSLPEEVKWNVVSLLSSLEEIKREINL